MNRTFLSRPATSRTRPAHWARLPGACGREQFDFEEGVLILAQPPAPAQHFVLDPRSTVLWVRVILLRARNPVQPRWDDGWVLPSELRAAVRLTKRVQQVVAAAGFGSRAVFIRAVKLWHICDGIPPLVIWRRAGHLFTTPERVVQFRVSGEPVGVRPRGEAAVDDAVMPSLSTRRRVDSARPSWRKPVAQILRDLRSGIPAGRTRRHMAVDLDKLVVTPRWGAEAGIIGRLFCEWAGVLLRSPRRQNTVRAYLGRIGRAIDAGLLMDSVICSTSAPDMTATVSMIVDLYRTRESRRSALRVLRAFLDFADGKGYGAVHQVAWRRLARKVDGGTRAESPLSPSDLRATASALCTLKPDGPALAAAVVLSGCAGLHPYEDLPPP